MARPRSKAYDPAMLDLRLDFATFEADRRDLLAVREEVFVVEQGVPPELEVDDDDPRSIHVLARDPDGRPIGTGRLTPDGRIGRMAVLKPWRGRGVGSAILRSLLETARQRGAREVSLSSQVAAEPFYARFGFVAEGELYDDAGIPHRTMRLALTPLAEPPRRSASEKAILEEAREIDSLAAAREAVDRIIEEARHALLIYTRDLEPELYDREPVLEGIKRVALSGRQAKVMILVQEPALAASYGHRLVHLAQRLPTAIEIRTPVTEEDRQFPSAFVVNDGGGLLVRPIGSRWDGEARFAAKGGARQWRDLFEQVWQRAVPPLELRRLAL
jgi:predicted GNAT family N-acyltransferase